MIPNLVINPRASGSLINLDLLLLHTAHFDKSIIFPLIVFETFGFKLLVSFLRFQQYDNLVLIFTLEKAIYLVFEYTHF